MEQQNPKQSGTSEAWRILIELESTLDNAGLTGRVWELIDELKVAIRKMGYEN